MTRYFLGVDVGSSKTHAVIADEQGQVLGFGRGGAGNWEGVGVDGFTSALQQAVNGALTDAELERQQITGLGLGVSGYDWVSDDPMMHEVINTLNLQARYRFVNDAVIGLIAGAHQGWGVSVIAGTGCNACGRNRQGKEGRVTGNGSLFGEYGGGSELVRAALGAISREWAHRAPATRITPLFVEHFQAKNAEDLLEGIARGRFHYKAAQAPLIFRAVNEGDPVAIELVEWMGRELGDMGVGVIRQIGIADQEFEVVLAGSLFKGTPLLSQSLLTTIQTVAPGASLVRLDAPPVVGAVMLGMEQVGLDFTRLRDRLIETTNQRLESFSDTVKSER